MSTRSRIAMKTSTGYKSVYCHNHGEPRHVGATLARHYKTDANVAKLISMGYISELGKTIGKKHDFDEYPRSEDSCTFYMRDRGETDLWSDDATTFDELLTQAVDDDAVFIYLWENGGWSYAEVRRYGPPVHLSPLVAETASTVDAGSV